MGGAAPHIGKGGSQLLTRGRKKEGGGSRFLVKPPRLPSPLCPRFTIPLPLLPSPPSPPSPPLSPLPPSHLPSPPSSSSLHLPSPPSSPSLPLPSPVPLAASRHNPRPRRSERARERQRGPSGLAPGAAAAAEPGTPRRCSPGARGAPGARRRRPRATGPPRWRLRWRRLRAAPGPGAPPGCLRTDPERSGRRSRPPAARRAAPGPSPAPAGTGTPRCGPAWRQPEAGSGGDRKWGSGGRMWRHSGRRKWGERAEGGFGKKGGSAARCLATCGLVEG